MGELQELPNIGKELEKCLNDVGILTKEQLIEVGTKEAFMRLKVNDPTACISRLSAIEGAIEGIRWHYLSVEKKNELKEFFNSFGNC